MLVPKKLKYRKPHRGRMRGQAKGGTEVQFGEYGLQALEASWITNRQIEAARIAMTRKIKRGGICSRRQARPCNVRDERGQRGSGTRRYGFSRPEATYKDSLSGAGRCTIVKVAEVRELDVEELERRLAATRRELFNLRFQHATGQLENTGQLKEVRKNIARLLTVLNQKQRENE